MTRARFAAIALLTAAVVPLGGIVILLVTSPSLEIAPKWADAFSTIWILVGVAISFMVLAAVFAGVWLKSRK